MSQATWLWQQPGTYVTRKVRLGWLQLGQSLLGRPVIQGLLACSVFFTLYVFIPFPARYIFPGMSAMNSRSSQKRLIGRISGEQKQPWHCNNGGPMVAVSISEVIHPLLSWYRGPYPPSLLYRYGSHTPAFYLWGSLNSQGRNLIEPSHLELCWTGILEEWCWNTEPSTICILKTCKQILVLEMWLLTRCQEQRISKLPRLACLQVSIRYWFNSSHLKKMDLPKCMGMSQKQPQNCANGGLCFIFSSSAIGGKLEWCWACFRSELLMSSWLWRYGIKSSWHCSESAFLVSENVLRALQKTKYQKTTVIRKDPLIPQVTGWGQGMVKLGGRPRKALGFSNFWYACPVTL